MRANHPVYFTCHVLGGKNATILIARKYYGHVWVKSEAQNLAIVELFARACTKGSERHNTLLGQGRPHSDGLVRGGADNMLATVL